MIFEGTATAQVVKFFLAVELLGGFLWFAVLKKKFGK
jgi:hypothetical protein